MENILEIKNLCKNYKNFEIKDINLNLKNGYIMGLVGQNGVGKSTIIKLIMNLIKKSSGEVKIFGLDNIKNEIEIKERIGFVYDELHFYDMMNAKELEFIISKFYKKWDKNKYFNLINNFNIDKNLKIKDMSKGMKMKLQLAQALSHNADLIIMDEPTSGLDPIFRKEILEILQEIMENNNKAILFSTHIISDLEKIADYITFIDNGSLILTDEIENIYENFNIFRLNIDNFNENKSIISNNSISYKENKLGVEGLINTSNLKYIENIKNIIIERPTLEDIMYYLSRRDKNETVIY